MNLETVREGLQSVYGQSVTSLFVDKAMQWKERTMKTEWKWNFAAQLGLVVMIALTAFFIVSAFVFVVPVVVKSIWIWGHLFQSIDHAHRHLILSIHGIRCGSG